MSTKQNCWEFHNCNREPGGSKVSELGVCPATTEEKLDGIHDGVNAGRSCWVVSGTYCQGDIQGLFAHKYSTCKDCDFYKKIQTENFNNFEVTLSLLSRLRQAE